ncbi:MAG: hypothetical protein AB1432_02445 [Bacteroidota bacterium]
MKKFDQIKEAKIKEASELFEKLGISKKYETDTMHIYESAKETKKVNFNEKLVWTRLSINSTNGIIIE